jgi:hypothetical protein
MKRKKIGLIMRKGYSIHEDHIETLRRFSDEIHLWTNNPESMCDPRFTRIHIVNGNNEEDVVIEEIRSQASTHGIDKFITWQETDIVLTAKLNSIFDHEDVPIMSALISRDKYRQREFMKINNIPSPFFVHVRNVTEAIESASSIGYPVILKPTLAASSMNVSLVQSRGELVNEFEKLQNLVNSQKGFYYNNSSQSIALIEEFMPGEEVTLDGIVMDEIFYLGGIHHKKQMMGPYFEEDEYSLPYCGNDEEELVKIAKQICQALNIKNSLFNVELRKDKSGKYKVVEFSIRISGGHVYRNIRDVYGIDLVAAHSLRIIEGDSQNAKFFLRRTSIPKASTCIKFIYREGLIKSNNPGNAAKSKNFRAYYPLAKPNDVVYCAPKGFDIVGLLSVWGKFDSPEDRHKTIEIANRLEKELDLKVSSFVEEGV